MGVAAIGAIMAVLLLACPAPAFAYYDRGAVGVETGVAQVSVQAGDTASVSVTVTPSSDDQTVGCGMPKCPQGCSSSCADENGQCTCAGTEYTTYYPTLSAVSSNAGVATAVVDGGKLTIYGRSAGTATITVNASLRQFTDGQATIEVAVTGEADASVPADFGEVDLPDAADVSSAKADIVKQTVMGRPVWSVRLNDAVDPMEQLQEMAGVDGEVVFYEGDTMFHPDYSVTFVGTAYAADDLNYVNPALSIEREATQELTQPLADAQDFAVLRFAQQGQFPCSVTTYAYVGDIFADDAAVALYSYDSTNRTFVRESIDVSIVGGYAMFATDMGKTYVLSAQDLSGTGVVASSASSASDGGSCCTSDSCATNTTGDACGCSTNDGIPVVPIVAGVIVVIAAAVVAAFVVRRHRRNESGAAGAADAREPGEGFAPSTGVKPDGSSDSKGSNDA